MQTQAKTITVADNASEYTATLETSLPAFLQDAEKAYLRFRLIEAGGNRADAAKAAGIPYETFTKKVRKHGLVVRAVAVEVIEWRA